MKSWGLGRGGALLGVLLVLMSALVVLPQGAHAQGKKVFGAVTDCVSLAPVGATVTLVDVHAQIPDTSRAAPAMTGYFEFTPEPGYYKITVKPNSFTHFTRETLPFRFDGTVSIFVNFADTCVNKMPDKTRWLNLTIVDASTTSASETLTFNEFSRGPENITDPGDQDYAYLADNVSLDFAPLGWDSERLHWVDMDTPTGGVVLVRGADYDYTETDAYNGMIHISNVTVQTRLENTLFNRQPSGWLDVSYKNVSRSVRLSFGQVSAVSFMKNGLPLSPPPLWQTLTLNNLTGEISIITQTSWRFGSAGAADKLAAAYSWSGALSGATVTVFDQGTGQPIANSVNTSQSGRAIFQVWGPGNFNVKTQKDQYQPRLDAFGIAASDVSQVLPLSGARTVRVYVRDTDDNPVLASQGLTGVLVYRGATNREMRVIHGTAQDNLLTLYAFDGNWRLIVDANGYTAYTEDVTITGSGFQRFVQLARSSKELFTTTVLPINNDWNNLTIYRNATFLQDSSFPGVENGFLRDLRWQIDLKFGNGDGDATDAVGPLRTYLLSTGPFYTVADPLLTVNGKTYISVNGTNAVNPPGPAIGSNFTVETWARYQISDTSSWIVLNKPRYFVNVTTSADKNTTVYQNNSYFVQLPRTYEKTSQTKTGTVDIRGFTRVEVDPAVDTIVSGPRANLIVEKSLTGVARAEVEGPAGKVHVKEADQSKYLAWVANNTKVVFSANKTTDRLNQAVNARDANFTWRFSNGTLPGDTGWGIWTTFNYTTNANQYTVNLTVRQVGGNVTWRDIKVVVDNLDPVANIMTNKTGWVRNPPPYTINEDQAIRFFGNASTDNLYGTTAGEVAEWSWDFDSDGTVDRTGSIINWNFEKPGDVTVTLFVKDFVGHRSANRTMDFVVRDVTPPVIDFVILDKSNEFREVTSLIEGKDYWFNASKTTDNSLEHPWDNVNLTYKFQWGDASEEGPFTGDNSSLNRSHDYSRFSSTGYKLNITVTDAAGKNATLTRTIIVQANVTAHPDISIIANTLKISPTPSASNPQEGTKVTFTVNITNAKDRENATDLKVQFAIIEKGKDKNQTVTVTYIKNGTRETDPTLPAGWNLTVEIVWTAPSPPANYSLKIKIWDGDEPTTWVTSANEQSSSLVVREAGWKFWAIVGAFLFIVFGLPIIYYLVRKVRAGEISLRRRRGAEDEDEEAEEEDEDEDEEDEDRGGKKRL